jgi:hypothetical protein
MSARSALGPSVLRRSPLTTADDRSRRPRPATRLQRRRIALDQPGQCRPDRGRTRHWQKAGGGDGGGVVGPPTGGRDWPGCGKQAGRGQEVGQRRGAVGYRGQQTGSCSGKDWSTSRLAVSAPSSREPARSATKRWYRLMTQAHYHQRRCRPAKNLSALSGNAYLLG